MESGELSVQSAQTFIYEKAAEEQTLRTIQRDLKMIADTLPDVMVISRPGLPSTYKYPSGPNNRPKARVAASKVAKKTKAAIAHDTDKSDNISAPDNSQKATVSSTKTKETKKAAGYSNDLPDGFNKINKFALKAQRIIAENRRLRVPKELAEEVRGIIERNSIPVESVKFSKKGKVSINLRKVKPKHIAPILKQFGDKIELE